MPVRTRGSFRSTAYREYGVAPATFGRWERNGQTYSDSIYADFRRAVAAAESRAEHQMITWVVKVETHAASVVDYSGTRFTAPQGRR
ncbi:hypothetical protein [Limnoglobus roseus]|uniref:Uncharacterized protein n=1 Tax=Limnoglobus roseus TaxID=2598579 RepID=A0A5C1AGJ9_9BACT|nr:hypothetical protein [Limnoglobus roseus]QEL17106.1 hypothetical protein PX52LOC_04083 [Limnoglobus roseus]